MVFVESPEQLPFDTEIKCCSCTKNQAGFRCKCIWGSAPTQLCLCSDCIQLGAGALSIKFQLNNNFRFFGVQ